jgi:hypothetical protein
MCVSKDPWLFFEAQRGLRAKGFGKHWQRQNDEIIRTIYRKISNYSHVCTLKYSQQCDKIVSQNYSYTNVPKFGTFRGIFCTLVVRREI